MDRVVAKGKYQKQELTVECTFNGEQIEFLFNGERDFWLEGVILNEMALNHPISGTYYPTTKKLNLVGVLQGYFFDVSPDIEIEGDIEQMPSDKGRVY